MDVKARIHIENLDGSVTKDYLYNLFVTFGNIIDVDLATDVKGRPRGFANIQFEDPDDAEAAIDNMEGAQLFGRTLSVKHGRKGPVQVDSSKPVWEQEEFLKSQSEQN